MALPKPEGSQSKTLNGVRLPLFSLHTHYTKSLNPKTLTRIVLVGKMLLNHQRLLQKCLCRCGWKNNSDSFYFRVDNLIKSFINYTMKNTSSSNHKCCKLAIFIWLLQSIFLLCKNMLQLVSLIAISSGNKGQQPITFYVCILVLSSFF